MRIVPGDYEIMYGNSSNTLPENKLSLQLKENELVEESQEMGISRL